MQIKRTLDCPAAYFYTKLVDSAVQDIKHHTGNQPSAARLQGYSYQKPVGRGQARVTITKLVPNRSYVFETTTPGVSYTTDYELQETQDNQVEVTFTESSLFASRLRHWNQQLMLFLLGSGRKRQFNQMLTAIEQSYRA